MSTSLVIRVDTSVEHIIRHVLEWLLFLVMFPKQQGISRDDQRAVVARGIDIEMNRRIGAF
jgi:hypothetical protein